VPFKALILTLGTCLLTACGYAMPPGAGPYGGSPYLSSPYLQAPAGAYQAGYNSGYAPGAFAGSNTFAAGYGGTDDAAAYGSGAGYAGAYDGTGYAADSGAYSAYPADSGTGFASAGAGFASEPGPDMAAYPPQQAAYGAASTDAGQGNEIFPVPAFSALPAAPAPTPLPALSQAEVNSELSVLTYNVWGLPGPLGTDRKARFERLGPTLNAYDVVTLQETFSDEIEVLKHSTGFAHHVRHNNGSFPRIGSGLYTLSKYPVIHTDYQAFGRCTAADCMARKGVLLTRIQHPKIGMVDIYTTHYQAEGTPAAQKIRLEDNNQVFNELIQRNHSPYPVILTGDFNFTPDQLAYRALVERLGLVDLYPTLHPGDPGYTIHPNNPYKAGGTAKRLDYIFYLPKPGIQFTPLEAQVLYQEPVDGYVLSDHYGVSARFKLEVKSAE